MAGPARALSAEAVARAYAHRLLPARVASALFWRLASRSEQHLAGRSVVTSVRFGDAVLRLRLPLDHRQSWTMMFRGFARSGDALMLAEFARRSRTARGIIDVGANAGLYTYHAAAAASPTATVIAVEAIVELSDVINENLALNGRVNARAVNGAVSDAEGEVAFYVAASDQASSLDPAHVEAYGGAVGAPRRVRATTIDRLVERSDMAHVDLMKIDVEGHELSALAGALQTLDRHRPTLFLEAKRENAQSARELLAVYGYRMQRFESIGCVDLGDSMVPGDDPFANFLCESPH